MKRYIVLHHSATPDGKVLRDFDAIKKEHIKRGWRDIGYHWVIEKVNGALTAIPGRREWESGAHCVGRNVDGIGICLIGNYEKQVPNEEQYRFVANLCRQIMTRYPIIEIGGHQQYDATLCPGRFFDVDTVRRLVKEGDPINSATPCEVDVKGIKFPGWLKGGRSYFDEACRVSVVDVVKAISPSITWDDKTRTVIIK
jgi:N-acetylmuramoyl-L-alanine amidase